MRCSGATAQLELTSGHKLRMAVSMKLASLKVGRDTEFSRFTHAGTAGISKQTSLCLLLPPVFDRVF